MDHYEEIPVLIVACDRRSLQLSRDLLRLDLPCCPEPAAGRPGRQARSFAHTHASLKRNAGAAGSGPAAVGLSGGGTPARLRGRIHAF